MLQSIKKWHEGMQQILVNAFLSKVTNSELPVTYREKQVIVFGPTALDSAGKKQQLLLGMGVS